LFNADNPEDELREFLDQVDKGVSPVSFNSHRRDAHATALQIFLAPTDKPV
jgi:hypothetical protein